VVVGRSFDYCSYASVRQVTATLRERVSRLLPIATSVQRLTPHGAFDPVVGRSFERAVDRFAHERLEEF